MTEKRIITFTPEGVGYGISFLGAVPEGCHALPDAMASNLASRYALRDGQIVDLYPDKTDDQVVAILHAEEVKSAQALRAQRQGQSIDTLDGARAFKISEVRSHFNKIIEGIRADAAPYEVETWAVQRDEYARWAADRNAATPYVDGLCAGRGIAKDELMPKIGVKVANLASVQGAQHATEKEVLAAETIEAVLAIELPGV